MPARDPLATLAANVKAARTDAGLTQEHVAHAAGLALSDVGRIERAERDPGIRVLTKLAKGLGTTIEALVHGIR